MDNHPVVFIINGVEHGHYRVDIDIVDDTAHHAHLVQVVKVSGCPPKVPDINEKTFVGSINAEVPTLIAELQASVVFLINIYFAIELLQ